MWEAIRVANRALVGAMLRHLHDIPRMGDDEGVLRIRMLTAAHHGTMPSSLPPELESIPGATIDRWIRVGEHLNHLGAEEGPTMGWTPGDVVSYYGEPGLLTHTSGIPLIMRSIQLQPDLTERGVVDLPITLLDHLTVINRNPYSHTWAGWGQIRQQCTRRLRRGSRRVWILTRYTRLTPGVDRPIRLRQLRGSHHPVTMLPRPRS